MAASVAAQADEFVGRVELINALVGTPPHGAARVADAFGIAGIGKTWLVKRLESEAIERHGALHLPMSFDSADAPATVSQAFDAFVEVVMLQAARVFGGGTRDVNVLGAFENELSSVKQERAALVGLELEAVVHADNAVITDSNVGTFDVDVDVGGLEGVLLGEKARSVASAFASRFAPLVKRRPALITVDGFDAIAGSALARWLIALLAQLPNTLVVLMRSPGAAAPSVPGSPPEHIELEPFSRDDVADLLARYLSGRQPDLRLADLVYEWSQGHPFTVALAGKYLRALGDSDPDAFAARLAELPEDYTKQRIEIALAIVRAPGSGELEDLARACATARRFDAELLNALLAGELPVPAEDAIERLQQAGVVEAAGAPGWFRVHSFIREPLKADLDSARRRCLHQRAAAHYYRLLSADEPELDTGARAYEGWFRYEKPAWQAQLREWLYHLREGAHTEDEMRRARLQFARVFLDAFWWWGCYLDFPFCHDLVADWERVRGDDADWVQDLRLLLASYPTGYRKQDAEEWSDARAALVGVRDACGLGGDADTLRVPLERHTRGLIDNFLADSCHFRSCSSAAERGRAYEQALGYHQEAAQLFDRNEETWELAWTLFETAELHGDFDALPPAREAWQRAVGLALEEEDWELKANLHRLRADLRWRDGATADAFDAHGRALLHAYFFQCKTQSHRPDPYTVVFYREQVERAFDRLRGLEDTVLADAVARLARPFGGGPPAAEAVAPLLVGGNAQSLEGPVVPDAPREDELLECRSPFTRRVDTLAEDLGADVERDLVGVEP
jgi:hypothetical protein